MRTYWGEPAYKISVDAGFTCPVRDGKINWESCVFCNPKSYTPPWASRFKPIKEQVLEGIERAKEKGYRKFLVYFQPYTNTYADVEKLRKVYEEALSAHPDIVGMFIGTRPDCLPPEVLDLLSEIAQRTFLVVELGLQSGNNRTLEIIKRGHTVEDFVNAVEELHRRGIKVIAHVILGLPNDTPDDWVSTAHLLSEVHILGVKMHPLHVVRWTELEKWYREGKYKPLELDEYVDGVILFLENLKTTIWVARLTGEAIGGTLVAPSWCNRKFEVLTKIQQEMERRDTWQGRKITPQLVPLLSGGQLLREVKFLG